MKKLLILLTMFSIVLNVEAAPRKKPKPKFGKYSHHCPKKKDVINAKYW